jgi:hypothetical protein
MLNKWLRSRGVHFSVAVIYAQLFESVFTLLKEIPPTLQLDDIPDKADFTAEPGGIQWDLEGESNFSKLRDVTLSTVISNEFIGKVQSPSLLFAKKMHLVTSPDPLSIDFEACLNRCGKECL